MWHTMVQNPTHVGDDGGGSKEVMYKSSKKDGLSMLADVHKAI